jgi:hypothetical protein
MDPQTTIIFVLFAFILMLLGIILGFVVAKKL